MLTAGASTSGSHRPGLSRASALGLFLLLLLGLGVRLIDLTDPPLDFNPTRQLHSAMIARGMYYNGLTSAPEWQRQMAIAQWRGQETIEPRLLETLVAATYRLAGEENLGFARIYSSVFWLVGGIALFFLAREISSAAGALAGLAYYLFLPHAVLASRGFLPDPLMVACLVLGLWAVYRWSSLENPSWRATVVTGLIASIAPFVKGVALIPLAGGVAGVLLAGGLRRYLGSAKTWLLGAITLLPAGVYYAWGYFGARAFASRFYPELVVQLRFYLDWQEYAVRIVGYGAIAAAVLGTLLALGRARGLLVGLWVGYIAYGILFPFHIVTHDYYHLPLVPILALGISSVASIVMERLGQVAPVGVWRVVAACVLAGLLMVPLREDRGVLMARDYRPEVRYWEYLGDLLGHPSNVMMISHDYGFRLRYFGWVMGSAWLGGGDPRTEELLGEGGEIPPEMYRQALAGYSYFVVTTLADLERQPALRGFLMDNYSVFAEGEDFIIFDLQRPLQGSG
jgi:4-amino-4-deoxy-L-arabinose transferase-like glycosyltransferase